MWPTVDLENRKISGFAFNLRHINNEEWKSPNTKIEEIVMIYANFVDVSFSSSDVVCAVEYDTDFGLHTILFSKVAQLDFDFKGCDWISIYSSNPSPKYISSTQIQNDGPEEPINQEILTDIYKDVVKDFDESDIQPKVTIPSNILENLLKLNRQ